MSDIIAWQGKNVRRQKSPFKRKGVMPMAELLLVVIALVFTYGIVVTIKRH
jgi:hypothetical protein|nr:MAG TPA: hypothetical protein [Bacteriophage sp.]